MTRSHSCKHAFHTLTHFLNWKSHLSRSQDNIRKNRDDGSGQRTDELRRRRRSAQARYRAQLPRRCIRHACSQRSERSQAAIATSAIAAPQCPGMHSHRRLRPSDGQALRKGAGTPPAPLHAESVRCARSHCYSSAAPALSQRRRWAGSASGPGRRGDTHGPRPAARDADRTGSDDGARPGRSRHRVCGAPRLHSVRMGREHEAGALPLVEALSPRHLQGDAGGQPGHTAVRRPREVPLVSTHQAKARAQTAPSR